MTRGWLVIYLLVLAWSAWQPADRMTWWLEVAPALFGFGLLYVTRRRFPLTALAYWLVLLHCIVLMVGGHYTYAEVPLFDWLAGQFNWHRNYYDKVGHLLQGFVPALLAREILLRRAVINGYRWMNFFVVCFCLALSACYELIEWWVAVLVAEAADAFLGTQGYVWDTQSDMAYALVGAILSLLILSRYHDRQLRSLGFGTGVR